MEIYCSNEACIHCKFSGKSLAYPTICTKTSIHIKRFPTSDSSYVQCEDYWISVSCGKSKDIRKES